MMSVSSRPSPENRRKSKETATHSTTRVPKSQVPSFADPPIMSVHFPEDRDTDTETTQTQRHTRISREQQEPVIIFFSMEKKEKKKKLRFLVKYRIDEAFLLFV